MTGTCRNIAARQRLDHALVERGLAPTRSQARDLVRRGLVMVDGRTAEKAGLEVGAEAAVVVAEGAQPFVSRGGLKLAAALDHFALSPAGLVAVDLGASTGGFSHVLLERGARRVFAIDVGHGQLHPSIAGDSRVVGREGVDVRTLTSDDVGDAVDAIVADLSFISLTQALGPALALASKGAWLVALVKPQFEAGREGVNRGGIVKSEAVRLAACEKVRDWLTMQEGWRVLGVIPSPIEGGSGNREFLIGARRD